jgi:hypothetical protein
MVVRGAENTVMHASLRIGETMVLGSDGRCEGRPSFQGFALSLTAPNESEGERLFASLGDGGQGADAVEEGSRHQAPSRPSPAGRVQALSAQEGPYGPGGNTPVGLPDDLPLVLEGEPPPCRLRYNLDLRPTSRWSPESSLACASSNRR